MFDRELRRIRRDRAYRSEGAAFVHDHAFAEILDRLGDVRRRFGNSLLFGCGGADWPARLAERVGTVTVADPAIGVAAANGGVAADEDRLPFADGSFELVVAVGTLDSVDDLPGALVLLRRALRPDGLLLCAMAAAGSLARTRAAMLAADATGGGAAPRMHPAIDVRGGGDLLARAGFALPVADTEPLDISYAAFPKLVGDLRAHGATNMLDARSRRPLGRMAYAAAAADFTSHAVAGRTVERVEILYLSGWHSSSDPPPPAEHSLATRPNVPVSE